ncbi:TetR/AcrR family transcriptional regulator [Streptomyces sp. WM6368]|uniref:TetR/AcrR family transcriptional regulator n=1 Tax=Streptomyces sp. WM6368 TaxID=1415554 RepID=UPI0006ADEBA4|nr:helix-turn-helix domain-containing protein [Streptomyces sp. WM6368]
MVTAADPGEPRTSVWLAARPAAPARRRSEAPSGLDRDRITAATVRLLDADGLARFSMRRLAAGLGVTAMSLYWYVDTKQDLLELALDRALGEVRLPAAAGEGAAEGGGAGWPGRLQTLARSYRRVQRLLDATGLVDAARTGAHLAVSQFLHGCGGTVRRAPEGDFCLALDVLIAGIEAKAPAGRASTAQAPAGQPPAGRASTADAPAGQAQARP